MRRPLLIAAAAAGSLALPAAASAATVGIQGLDDGGLTRFSPADAKAAPGDSATWSFPTAAAPHNVFVVPPGVDPANTAAHESLGIALPGGGTKFSRTLDKAGIYLYYCSFHGGLAPGGMSGRVVVGAVTAPPPLPTGPAPRPNTTVFSGPFEEGDVTPPALTKVGVLAAGRTLRVRYVLSEPGTVTVRLARGRRVIRTAVFKDRGAGVGTAAVKRIGPGRYTVRVSATDAAGLGSRVVRRKVAVRR
jgi:plastocyanin